MAEPTTWSIDPDHSSAEFSVKHMMFTTVRGRMKDLKGTILVDEDNPENSAVEVEIDAASIDTGSEDRDKHLRSAEFFDAEAHPKITFKSTRIEGSPHEEGEKFRVIGDLTIRGDTMEVALDAKFEGLGQDPWGMQRAGFGATTEVDRRDWGLRWNQALETGGVLVGNNVKIELEIQAVKREAEREEAA